MNPKKKIIFHTGRGGRFHNGGYITAKKIIANNFDAVEAEKLGYNVFYNYKGEPFDLPATPEEWEGIDPQEIKVLDGGGDEVCDYSDILADYGTMNFDNEYDGITWKTFDLLEEEDFFVMLRDLTTYECYTLFVESDKYNFYLLQLLFLDGKRLNLSARETAEILADDYPTDFDELVNCGLIEEYDPEGGEYSVVKDGKRYQLNWI